jgi:hypothetical protein
MIGENQSTLYLFLLITANMIPLVNRFFANIEAKNNAKKIIAGTAAQSTVDEVNVKADTTVGKLSSQDEELAELKRMVLALYNDKYPKTSAYVPINPEKKS